MLEDAGFGGGDIGVRVFIGDEEIRQFMVDVAREEMGNITRRFVAGRR